MKPITMPQVANMNMNYNHFSFNYFLDSMERLGMTNFELWAGSPHFCNSDSATSPVPKMKKAVAERGLKIVCVTPEQIIYPYNIAARDEELRARSVEYFCQYIRQTAELGVDKMLCGSGWGDNDEPVEDAWKRSVDSLHQMSKVAEKEGVNLAFEILQPGETNLVNSLETTKRMMDELTSPNVKLCIDTVPVCREGKTLEEFFKIFGDRIIHIHLIDGNPTGHMTWGDGNQPLEEHLATLSRNNYTGVMTLELAAGHYASDPEYHFKRGIDFLGKYLPYECK
jgi:protein FrlC